MSTVTYSHILFSSESGLLQSQSFSSHILRRSKEIKRNARRDISLLDGIRGGTLRSAFEAIMVRHEKRGVFNEKPLTSLEAPTWTDIEVELDDTGNDPCIFKTKEERDKILRLASKKQIEEFETV